MTIAQLCEELVDAFQRQGDNVRGNLRPGLSRKAIFDLLARTGLMLPESAIQLYEWADGHVDNEAHDNVIFFRDNTFISLSWAVNEYFQMQSTYGGSEASIELTGVEIERCFPISVNNGAWDTVVCGRHTHDQRLDNPIVQVFQGYDLYYNSVETMLRTCIAWVNSPEWRRFHGLPQVIEQEIWARENPIRAAGPN